MDWQQLVISALVGAAIGYITNWTAIKMLFRPLKSKRILGIRLPFTPGVIPKEKTRLAESIGDAVSKHLLTQEYISGQLMSPQAEEKLRLFVRKKIDDIADKTLAEVLDGLGVDSRARENWLERINKLLLKSARDDRLQAFLAGRMAEGTVHFLHRSPAELLETGEYEFLKGSLEKGIAGFLSQDETREQFKQFLTAGIDKMIASPLTLKECIPGPMLDAIMVYARDQGSRIADMVDNYLNSPEIKQMLTKRVASFFEQGLVRRLMGNILRRIGNNPRQVADKIVGEVASFFAEPDNRDLLTRKAENLVDDMLSQRICDLAARLDVEKRKSTLLALGSWLSSRLCSEEIIEGLLNRAESALANTGITWGRMLGLNDNEDAGEKANEYYRELITMITSGPGFETALVNFTANAAVWVLDTKTTDVYDAVFGGKELLEVKMLGYYRSFIQRHLEEIVSFINFRQLVTRRVDDLDILQVEELVLGIMRRELVAITWFGAILGAGIGIIMVILQVFF